MGGDGPVGLSPDVLSPSPPLGPQNTARPDPIPSHPHRLARERNSLQQECKELCQELREATECREVGAA